MRMSITGICNRRGPRAQPCKDVRVAGFTLLELLVVMVLIAFAGALTMPKLQLFLQGDELETSARKAIGLVQQTAQLARQQQRQYVLRYAAVEHVLVAEPVAAPARQNPKAGNASERVHSLHLPQTVRLVSLRTRFEGQRRQQQPRLYISGKGYAEPALIILANEDGGQLSLVVPPFLGRIQVLEGHVDVAAAGLFR